MLENGKNEYIFKKSYEIAYALWRVAGNITEPLFEEKIGKKAIELVGYASDGDSAKIGEHLPGIELLLKFGADVNAISLGNYEIISREIGNLKSAILEDGLADKNTIGNPSFKNLMKKKDMDVFDVFLKSNGLEKKDEMITDELPENYAAEDFFKGVGLVEIEQRQEDVSYEDSEGYRHSQEIEINGSDDGKNQNTETPNDNGTSKAEIRQSAILERIRQIGNCQLSDIQVILPETSERTIRYDLEALVQRKLIERVGTGGRGVYYKMATNGH